MEPTLPTHKPAARRNLYYLRRMKGWSQQNLADLVGVSRVYVHLVESGKQPPSVRFSVACETLFAVDAAVVFAAVGATAGGR